MPLPLSLEIVATDRSRVDNEGAVRNIGAASEEKNASCGELACENASCSELQGSQLPRADGPICAGGSGVCAW